MPPPAPARSRAPAVLQRHNHANERKATPNLAVSPPLPRKRAGAQCAGGGVDAVRNGVRSGMHDGTRQVSVSWQRRQAPYAAIYSCALSLLHCSLGEILTHGLMVPSCIRLSALGLLLKRAREAFFRPVSLLPCVYQRPC
jgi:hypothetical protein